MRKFFLKIHLWLSIPTGLIITIICLSGAILVFQEEINEAIYHDKYFVKEKKGEVMPLGELIGTVNKNLDNNSVRSVQIPSNSSKNYIMVLKEGNFAMVCVNPYTGEITGKIERGKSLTGWVMRLHRWLLDSNRTIGKPIVGYTTILFVIILITGIVVWWPKTRKQIKSRLKLETKYGWKRFWLDTHTNAGMYACLILLALALTGLTYSFSWYNKGFYKMLGVSTTTRAHEAPKPQHSGKGKPQQGEFKGKPTHGGTEASFRAENSPREGREHRASMENGNRSYGKPNAEQSLVKDSISDAKTDKPLKGNDKDYNDTKENKGVNTLHWAEVAAELKEKYPDFKVISIQDGSATLSHKVRFGNARASDKFTFNPESGQIIKSQLYKDQPRSSKVRGWVYSIHIGAWGGMFSKILTSLVALFGASLPITGYYMFYIKRKGKFKKKMKK